MFHVVGEYPLLVYHGSARIRDFEVDEHFFGFFEGEHRVHTLVHVFCLFRLPFSIRTFEYEDIEKDDEDTHDDREKGGDLGTGSECHSRDW